MVSFPAVRAARQEFLHCVAVDLQCAILACKLSGRVLTQSQDPSVCILVLFPIQRERLL